jgi:hypothetical protein
VSSTLCNSAWISSMGSNRRPFSLNLIFGNRNKSQGAKSGDCGGWGMTAVLYFARNCWVRTGVCDGALSWWSSQVYSRQVRGDVFAHFNAVAAKCRSRTRNTQSGLFGPVLRATTTATTS